MKKNESNHLDSKTVLNASTHFGMTVLRLVFLLMMCFVVLYPILYMFSVSVREAKDLYDPTVIWIPRNFTMENYKYIWELIDYPRVLGETAQITVISTIIHVFICAMIGYGFARFNFRFKGVLFGLVIFTLLVPSQLVSIPMYVQYRNFDFFGLGQLGCSSAINPGRSICWIPMRCTMCLHWSGRACVPACLCSSSGSFSARCPRSWRTRRPSTAATASVPSSRS